MSEGEIHYSLCRNSDHVLKFVETFTEGKMTYIVTELSKGGDLLSYLRKRREPTLSEDEARHIFVQLVSSVRKMHKQGIVHRDFKKTNIFVSGPESKPKVKIGDFGLACEL